MKGCLNRNQIKYIAIIAMVIDHTAWAFVPTASLLGQIMHVIGRLSAATMAYMVAEGYVHTRDIRKYVIRMGAFAFISWPAFSLFEEGTWPTASVGVIYPLFLGLLGIWMWDELDAPVGVKLLCIAGLCLMSEPGDWSYLAVLWVFFFFVFRNFPTLKWITFAIVAAIEVASAQFSVMGTRHPYIQVFQFGVFLVIPFLALCYNGKPGGRDPFNKWFFYIFYPAHLLILYLLEYYVF